MRGLLKKPIAVHILPFKIDQGDVNHMENIFSAIKELKDNI